MDDKLLLLGIGWLVCAIVCGAAGYAIGEKYRRQRIRGMMLGAGLLAVGLPAIFALRDRRPKCRYCRQPIDDEAENCPHCQRKLPGGGGSLVGMMRLASSSERH